MKKLWLLLFVSFIFVSNLFGVENSSDTPLKKISLQLQWKYQFQFAGFIMAKELGYYKDAGLDVDLLEFNNSDIMGDLESGKVDYAISNATLSYKTKKLKPFTLLATYFQRSPLILVTQPEIKSPSDLYGKTIMASHNDIYNSSLSILLEYYSIDTKDVNFIAHTFNLNDFIEKKVDAVAVFKSHEVFTLLKKKIPFNIIDPADYGFSTTAINLITTYKNAKQNPQEVLKFVNATNRGWKYALENLNEVATLIHKKYQKNESLELLKYEAKITKELMLTKLFDIGEINSNFVKKTLKQLIKKGILDKNQTLEKTLYKPLQTKNSIFNDAEKRWIQEHPSVKYSEVNWKPLSIIHNNQMDGIMGDYLKLVSEKAGLKFEFVPSASWSNVLEQFKNKKIDLIPGVDTSFKNDGLGLISKKYASYPLVIVTRDNYSFINNLDELTAQTIAVPKHYTSYNYLKTHYPNLRLVTTENIPQALMLLERGEADAFVGHIATSIYYISQLHLKNLKISGEVNFTFEHRYLVQKENPILLSIINKAFANISNEEKIRIRANWVQTTYEKTTDYSILYAFVTLFTLIIAFLLYRQRVANKHKEEAQRSKERVELALAASRSGIWEWNIQKDTVYFSPRWKEIIGYGDDAFENKYSWWESKMHPDDLKEMQQAVQKCLYGQKDSFEKIYRLKHKNGSWVYVKDISKTYYDKNNKAYLMTGTHTDISKEIQLQLKNSQLAQMVEQTHDSVIATDLQGYIETWNRGSEIIFGYTPEEAIGQHMSMLSLEKEKSEFYHLLRDILNSPSIHQDMHLLTKDNKEIYVAISLSVLKDKKGKITNIVGYTKDITQRKIIEERVNEQKDILNHQANHDALTGLANRVLFFNMLQKAIIKAKRKKSKVALLFLDLDHFKEINDSLGHDVGDEVLKIVTAKLKSVVREEDTLARLGGDEFTIILEDLKQGQDASILALKIIEELSEAFLIKENKLYVSSSIGISIYPSNGTTPKDLLKYADAAMYKAKDEGRNNFQYYESSMTELALERVLMEASLKDAIQNEEFVVYYQPQVDGLTNRLVGMEALVRWQHPKMGLVSPDKFIPIAEDSGLIIDIDTFVMRTAMKQMVQWYKESLNPHKVSLNLSVNQLKNKNFTQKIKEMLSETQCKAEWIELEVTEGQVMKNPEDAIEILTELNALGILLSIDDFGTGYSSLSYLKRLPIHKLKIDQSFVKGLPEDEDDSAITKAVIALGQSLKLELIAEGVETQEQKEFIVSNGCPNIQGYLYSRPVPADELKEILINGF